MLSLGARPAHLESTPIHVAAPSSTAHTGREVLGNLPGYHKRSLRVTSLKIIVAGSRECLCVVYQHKRIIVASLRVTCPLRVGLGGKVGASPDLRGAVRLAHCER